MIFENRLFVFAVFFKRTVSRVIRCIKMTAARRTAQQNGKQLEIKVVLEEVKL